MGKLCGGGGFGVTGLELERTFLDKPPVPLILEDDEFPEYQRAWGAINPLFGVQQGASGLHWITNTPLSFKLSLSKKRLDTHLVALGNSTHKGKLVALLFAGGVTMISISISTSVLLKENVVYAGGGLLVFHSKTGGDQKIKLKNGKEVLLKMPVGAGTVALDAETGKVVLE